MYQLLVMKAGDHSPHERVDVRRSQDVLAMIPKLLAAHQACERIEVHYNGGRLFSVDCQGNRID